MPLYPYRATLTLDVESRRFIANAVGDVFALEDTEFLTPLQPVDASGLPVVLRSSSDYILPTFYLDVPSANWKSGEYVFPLVTSQPLEGPQGDAGQDGAPGKDGTNVLPTDTGTAERIADPSSATATELRKTYGGLSDFTNKRPAPTLWTITAVAGLTKTAMTAASGKPTIYWPWVIETTGVIANALGRFYLYWSTDHDAGTGMISMAYANSLSGPWTIHGNVYVDTVEGNQTETPTVVVRGVGDLILFYQQDFLGRPTQRTMYATSSDGINWTRQGVAMGYPNMRLPGDGHTGYAKVYKVGGEWIAYTLAGGSNYPRQAIWYATDPSGPWTMDRRVFVNQVDLTGDNNYRVSMSLSLFQWRGDVWSFVTMKTPSSGGEQITAGSEAYVAKVRDDMRGFKEQPVRVNFGGNCVIESEGKLWGFTMNSTGVYAATIGV